MKRSSKTIFHVIPMFLIYILRHSVVISTISPLRTTSSSKIDTKIAFFVLLISFCIPSIYKKVRALQFSIIKEILTYLSADCISINLVIKECQIVDQSKIYHTKYCSHNCLQHMQYPFKHLKFIFKQVISSFPPNQVFKWGGLPQDEIQEFLVQDLTLLLHNTRDTFPLNCPSKVLLFHLALIFMS